MHASLEQKGLHSQGLSTRDAGWSRRQVINLLAPGFKTPKAIPSISFIIYERLMAFTSQPADAPVELSPALADPETRQSRRRLPVTLSAARGWRSAELPARHRRHAQRHRRCPPAPSLAPNRPLGGESPPRFLHGPRAVAKGCRKRR